MAFDYGHKVVIEARHHAQTHHSTVFERVDARKFDDELPNLVASTPMPLDPPAGLSRILWDPNWGT